MSLQVSEISIEREWVLHLNIIFESDSISAVQWCNAEARGTWNVQFALNKIRDFIRRYPATKIIHRCRESNGVADAMAKQGLERRIDFVAWV